MNVPHELPKKTVDLDEVDAVIQEALCGCADGQCPETPDHIQSEFAEADSAIKSNLAFLLRRKYSIALSQQEFDSRIRNARSIDEVARIVAASVKENSSPEVQVPQDTEPEEMLEKWSLTGLPNAEDEAVLV